MGLLLPPCDRCADGVSTTYLCKAKGSGLAAIAFILGFSDQAHFARSFSRSAGTTPSSYRADFGPSQV
ncbi:MAG: helix-turn-helix domain-containing protein [Natronohydrobacter sp.]|nr:helix-turn-helix domain-containing protein [Natronohydrobacter sp.]